MHVKDNLLLARSRADSYKLLSQCYFLPDENLLAAVNGIEVQVNNMWQELLEKAPELDRIKSLEVDYSKLFLGPFRLLAPPYGSVYLDSGGRVVGESTINIRNFYLDEGIDINIKEMPDHIAIELEFMYYLINKEINAINDGNDDRLGKSRNKQLYFLNEYVCCWISQFCRKVRDNSKTDFYKYLSELTETFVLNDLAFLEQELQHHNYLY